MPNRYLCTVVTLERATTSALHAAISLLTFASDMVRWQQIEGIEPKITGQEETPK
jgi:hypothetical protein